MKKNLIILMVASVLVVVSLALFVVPVVSSEIKCEDNSACWSCENKADCEAGGCDWDGSQCNQKPQISTIKPLFESNRFILETEPIDKDNAQIKVFDKETGEQKVYRAERGEPLETDVGILNVNNIRAGLFAPRKKRVEGTFKFKPIVDREASPVARMATGGTLTGHTHLADFKYVIKPLQFRDKTADTSLFKGVDWEANEYIDCAAELGVTSDKAIAVNGGYYLWSDNSYEHVLSQNYKILRNGPIFQNGYEVQIIGKGTAFSSTQSYIYATCAKVEPTLHAFGQDN